MTKKERKEPEDELDLDAETVADLEPGEEDAEEVRGGILAGGTNTGDLCTCKCQDPGTSGGIWCCGLKYSI